MNSYYNNSELSAVIYNENCISVMKQFDDNYIDLTVTSPPYDNLRKYEGISWNENIWKSVIEELYRITKLGGVVVWVVGDSTIKGSETGTSFKQALFAKDCGFNLHDTMIYAKHNPIPLTHNRYEQQFEYMFIWSKGKPKTFNPITQPCKSKGSVNNHKSEKHYETSHSMRKRDCNVITKETKFLYNIWFLPTGTNHKVAHNAPFPFKLASDHIISWSNDGDIILDPFMGSGTTLEAAAKLRRKSIGIEISQTYCDIAISQRLTI
jgi:DNA modification methylase